MVRRVPKLKVQLPEDDEAESELKRERAAGSDSSCFEGASSSDEESDAKAGSRKKASRSSSSSSSSSGSSSEEDSEEEDTSWGKKRGLVKATKKSSSGSESNSKEESSASNSSSEEESPPKKRQTPKTKKTSSSGSLKRLKRVSVASSSSGEDSELEEKSSLQDSKNSVKEEADDDDTDAGSNDEDELEQDRGSETASEDDWQAHLKDEESRKKDEIVVESDKGSESEWNEDKIESEEENDGEFSVGDIRQAKYVLRNITSRLPLIEETAIRRGVKLSGPPVEFATTHLDEYARKFRWPQHVRNLRKTDFSQDPSEVLEDYEVMSEIQQPDGSDQAGAQESAFAQVPRPIVALAAEALRQSSRKRKRAVDNKNQEERNEGAPSATALLNVARVGGQFGDCFVESLLSANGRALQGIDSDFDYDKRSWSSLPTKKKPIANWRFVLEHVRRTMGRSESSDNAVYPPMKPKTLDRITRRLKKLYGHTTQHEEYDIFEAAVPTSTYNATETPSEDLTGQPSE